MAETYLGWHFSMGVLGRDDGRPIVAGETHRVKGAIIPCRRGLHASAFALDALSYAEPNVTHVARVRLHGTVIVQGDKAVASHRTYLDVGPCEAVLHEFACRCAEAARKRRPREEER